MILVLDERYRLALCPMSLKASPIRRGANDDVTVEESLC